MSTPETTQLAAAFVHLIQRFTGNRPDALQQMREQIEREVESAQQMMERAQAQLAALDQLQEALSRGGGDELAQLPSAAPPLKTAILRVLNENPEATWEREVLYAEIVRRGWGPGGSNPRNTFTARLRGLELEGRVKRLDRDLFQSVKNEGALAV